MRSRAFSRVARPSMLATAAMLALTLAVAGCESEPPPKQPPVGSATGKEPPLAPPAKGAISPRTVYVPAYSHLRWEKGKRSLFSITLSVRNVDPAASVTLNHVDYYDTSGHRVRRYVAEPMVLRPLETAEFFVETSDDAGGSGANFLVYWEGPSDAHSLLTEAIMVGHVGAGFTTFTTRGVELDERPTIPPDSAAAPSADPSATGEPGPSPDDAPKDLFDGRY